MAERGKLRKLVIRRGQWLTGEMVKVFGEVWEEKAPSMSRFESSLHDPNTKAQCCMGFACRTLGLTEQEITRVGMPMDAKLSLKRLKAVRGVLEEAG